MHELPFAKSIFQSVMTAAQQNHAVRVVQVHLEVGELRDFVPEIVQKYWKYVAKDSIAAQARITMREIPASAECHQCGTHYPVTLRDLASCHCPRCGCDKGKLITGRELKIVNIEIE